VTIFKKLLASVGIGSARVDARLTQDSLIPGDSVSGEFHLTGGEVAQDIDEIYMYVITHYEREDNQKKIKEECTLAKHRLTEPISLQPDESLVVPFSFPLPYQTPLTMGRQPVYLRTGLDIKLAIDPGDSDFIDVRPHPYMEKVLDAIQSIGFQLYKVDCEYNPYLGGSYPFVQAFEFRPIGPLRSRVEELDVFFFLRDDGMDVYLELDRRARGYLSAPEDESDLDERYIRLQLFAEDLEQPLNDVSHRLENVMLTQMK
jgi:sporulation-control protein